MQILMVSVLCNVTKETFSSKEGVIGKEIDYTVLAGQAEMHKADVLGFLNKTDVKEKYKMLYQCLLDSLLSEYF